MSHRNKKLWRVCVLETDPLRRLVPLSHMNEKWKIYKNMLKLGCLFRSNFIRSIGKWWMLDFWPSLAVSLHICIPGLGCKSSSASSPSPLSHLLSSEPEQQTRRDLASVAEHTRTPNTWDTTSACSRFTPAAAAAVLAGKVSVRKSLGGHKWKHGK